MSKPHLLIMKAFIIDDSEIDRLNLRILLEDYPEIGVIAEAHSLKSARQLLSKQQPDLIFLDIHLGKEKGFDLLDTINDHVQVIITTSHPQYVLKDFGLSKLDHILKPVTEENLELALNNLTKIHEASAIHCRYPL